MTMNTSLIDSLRANPKLSILLIGIAAVVGLILMELAERKERRNR